MVHKIRSNVYNIDTKYYVKITRNTILVLDALMNDGGHIQKYQDNKKNYKYSEHFGMLDICGKRVDKIIISNKTNRIDKFDDSILLPNNIPDALEYEYIFHSHPPSPLPGSRAKDGVLYEFPSINDIFHFLEHFFRGETIGSIVVSPEGIYIIVPDKDIENINYNCTNKIYNNMNRLAQDIQELAIKKYGSEFSNKTFFSEIAQDTIFIKMYNKMLDKVLGKNRIKVLWKSRIYDEQVKEWIIPSFYLPIYKKYKKNL